ncbi:MAG: hypothetical protein LBL08_00785 [Candidatus Nomurabacteria bacterium]|nr:hypothetical protein [Candidatus Nomurabacteria bacterium]
MAACSSKEEPTVDVYVEGTVVGIDANAIAISMGEFDYVDPETGEEEKRQSEVVANLPENRNGVVIPEMGETARFGLYGHNYRTNGNYFLLVSVAPIDSEADTPTKYEDQEPDYYEDLIVVGVTAKSGGLDGARHWAIFGEEGSEDYLFASFGHDNGIMLPPAGAKVRVGLIKDGKRPRLASLEVPEED